jgi:hypothetical protein
MKWQSHSGVNQFGGFLVVKRNEIYGRFQSACDFSTMLAERKQGQLVWLI